MIAWLSANIGTIIVILLLIAAVAVIIAKTIKNNKEGKSNCGCGCAHCAIADECHKK